MLKRLWLLAVLALGACGGPAPPAEPEPGAGQAAANGDAASEPELIANDSSAPTIGRFELGRHYLRLSPTQPTSSNVDKIEVAEIFWYGCPHCFTFDPTLERWREAQPDYVSFIRVPAVWNPLLQLHARAFYTAEVLNKSAEMHSALFREIHENRNMLETPAKLQEFFGRFGVDAATFTSTFESFAVQMKLQRADELNRRYRIQSVPTLIVNGKYTTGGGETASYEEMLELVDELVASERAGR
jgi:protein dithiol oxidoreductase (disulfide-forming)